jgi:THO complex subunit 4
MCIKPQGTAEVVLSRKADAIAALKRYNNVQLDGKPMKIELIGTNLTTPVPATTIRVSNGAVSVNAGQRQPLVMAVYVLLSGLWIHVWVQTG